MSYSYNKNSSHSDGLLRKGTGHQTYQTESSLLDPDKMKGEYQLTVKAENNPHRLSSELCDLCTHMHTHARTLTHSINQCNKK